MSDLSSKIMQSRMLNNKICTKKSWGAEQKTRHREKVVEHVIDDIKEYSLMRKRYLGTTNQYNDDLNIITGRSCVKCWVWKKCSVG